MSLRVAVAAPFKDRGTDRLRENEFVVALSLDRRWFSPDQSKRLVDVATREGLLERDGPRLRLAVDPGEVTVPDGFVPDDDVLAERSAFERVLDALVAAGQEKHEAVGGINALQRDLELTIEAAAIVYARRQGVDVADVAPDARETLLEDG